MTDKKIKEILDIVEELKMDISNLESYFEDKIEDGITDIKETVDRIAAYFDITMFSDEKFSDEKPSNQFILKPLAKPDEEKEEET